MDHRAQRCKGHKGTPMAANMRQRLHLKAENLSPVPSGLCSREGRGGELGGSLVTAGESHQRLGQEKGLSAFHLPSTR